MGVRRSWIQAVTVAIDEVTGALLTQTGGGVTVKRVLIDASSDAAAGNTLVAAVPGQRISVLGMCLLAEEAVDVTLTSGPADTGTPLTGTIPLGDRSGFVLPIPNDPSSAWLQTEPGEALTLLLSTAWRCSGWLLYHEEA